MADFASSISASITHLPLLLGASIASVVSALEKTRTVLHGGAPGHMSPRPDTLEKFFGLERESSCRDIPTTEMLHGAKFALPENGDLRGVAINTPLSAYATGSLPSLTAALAQRKTLFGDFDGGRDHA